MYSNRTLFINIAKYLKNTKNELQIYLKITKIKFLIIALLKKKRGMSTLSESPCIYSYIHFPYIILHYIYIECLSNEIKCHNILLSYNAIIICHDKLLWIISTWHYCRSRFHSGGSIKNKYLGQINCVRFFFFIIKC